MELRERILRIAEILATEGVNEEYRKPEHKMFFANVIFRIICGENFYIPGVDFFVRRIHYAFKSSEKTPFKYFEYDIMDEVHTEDLFGHRQQNRKFDTEGYLADCHLGILRSYGDKNVKLPKEVDMLLDEHIFYNGNQIIHSPLISLIYAWDGSIYKLSEIQQFPLSVDFLPSEELQSLQITMDEIQKWQKEICQVKIPDNFFLIDFAYGGEWYIENEKFSGNCDIAFHDYSKFLMKASAFVNGRNVVELSDAQVALIYDHKTVYNGQLHISQYKTRFLFSCQNKFANHNIYRSFVIDKSESRIVRFVFTESHEEWSTTSISPTVQLIKDKLNIDVKTDFDTEIKDTEKQIYELFYNKFEVEKRVVRRSFSTSFDEPLQDEQLQKEKEWQKNPDVFEKNPDLYEIRKKKADEMVNFMVKKIKTEQKKIKNCKFIPHDVICSPIEVYNILKKECTAELVQKGEKLQDFLAQTEKLRDLYSK